MKITITGRHFEVSDNLSHYAEKKFAKLEKYFHKLIDIEMIMYQEKHDHKVEVVINGDGMRFHGIEKAEDMYSAVDLLNKSIEKQVIKHKEKQTEHKAQPLKNIVETESEVEEDLEILYNQVSNKPKDEVEAFLEMKMDNRDFILFKKNISDSVNSNLCYAVIFKSANGFRMGEISIDKNKEKRFDGDHFLEFDFIVQDDDTTNPKVKLKKSKDNYIRTLVINSALNELVESGDSFVPFYNNETTAFNVIYKNGENIEVIIPPV
jgi:putative sigma-54 modulation protein